MPMFAYREEIDGLRAFAVLIVILYHAGFTRIFAGGYVGVDIFFVISGYLITSLIESEYIEGNFSFTHFYERRCRRILPALFFILFITSIFAYYWMLPDQLEEFGQSLISIVTFSSNVFFWWKDDGYFAQLTELNPLVHTWSLAVEEQFYLIFPLLCYFFSNKKRYLIILLVCFALLSFFLAQWGGNVQSIPVGRFHMFSQHPWASFYLPVGRAWELLLGTFAAFYSQASKSKEKPFNKYNEFLALFGLVLITVSVLFFDNRLIHPFPNCYTLIPTVGTTLIILFGTNCTLVGRLLSTRPLCWIGQISYSAYLWHQPVLVFLRLQSNEAPHILTIFIIISVVLLLLAPFSYFFVERPFRDRQHFSRKQIFYTAFITSMVTLILGLFLIQTANNQLLASSNQGDSHLSDLQKSDNSQYVAKAFNDLAKRTNAFSNRSLNANRKIVLIGDSFVQDFYNTIIENKYLVNDEIRVHFIHTHCQIYIGPENRLEYAITRSKQKCTDANDIIYALPLIRWANIIILAINWDEWSAKRLPSILKLLKIRKAQHMFVIGAKDFGKVNSNLYVNKPKEYLIKQHQHPNVQAVKVNALLEQTIDQSVFVNVQKLICNGYNDTCPLFTPDGKLISFDGAHLTKYGARYIGNLIFNNKPLNILLTTNHGSGRFF